MNKEALYSVIAERVEELEQKAWQIYMENTEFDFVLDMLDEDERKEYEALNVILIIGERGEKE
jgi:hypothetical protein|tara:strand:+ start:375 stop:563 length:189 start_codon:yes stop_codon:yes gene_type:complete